MNKRVTVCFKRPKEVMKWLEDERSRLCCKICATDGMWWSRNGGRMQNNVKYDLPNCCSGP